MGVNPAEGEGSMARDDGRPRGALRGAPRTPPRYLSRPRLLSELEREAEARLLVLRGAGGSGKSSLLVDWLSRRPPAREAVVWISVDKGARTRAGLWHRIARTLVAEGHGAADGPLNDFLAGYVDLSHVPGHVLDALSGAAQRIRLVLDDAHLVDEDALGEVLWVLERCETLTLTVTTRQKGRLEDPDIAVRVETAVIDGRLLAFDAHETSALLGISGFEPTEGAAAIIVAATGGHPLATRIAIATLASSLDEPADAALDQEHLIGHIAARAARFLLPAFADVEHRHAALRLCLAPSAGERMAIALTGRRDAAEILRAFEGEGFGTMQDDGDGMVFSFHALIAQALEHEAERSLPEGELTALRRTAASLLTAQGDALGALRLYARLEDYGEIWPVVARNFSDLIVHHESELESILAPLPLDSLTAEGTSGIVLAIVRSEHEVLPSATVRQLVDGALAALLPRSDTEDELERFWILLAIFGGLRAARRYREASVFASRFLEHLSHLSPEARSQAGEAIAAGLMQVAITFILVGRWDDATAVAQQLAHDPHPGRGQHRLSLLAYIEAFRGDMLTSAEHKASVTHARVHTWRATVAATGWHVAESLARLEQGDPAGSLEVISALDSRLPRLEHWPYLVWVRAQARLAGPDPQLGLDELIAAMATNHARAASSSALDLLASVQSDLYLAAGRTARSLRALADRRVDSPPVVLARARSRLVEGDLDTLITDVSTLLWQGRATLRQSAQALLLQAVAARRLKDLAVAGRSARRAFALLDRYGLRSPLHMVPRADLLAIVEAELPERRGGLDGVPDPFGPVATPRGLTARERTVLTTLASSTSIDEVASRLFVSVNTVKSQLRSVYRKLGVSTREDALRVARLSGIRLD